MKYLINLLPEKEKKTVDKFIYFSFHYLRYILVITQFVVVCVFFFRFKIDQEIIDLKDSLTQKEEIVQATESLLTEVDTVNRRVDNTKAVLAKQNAFSEVYSYFFNTIPSSISINKLSFKDNSITCEGSVNDVTLVKMLYDRFIAEGKFNQVELENVRRIEDNYIFSLKLQNYKLK